MLAEDSNMVPNANGGKPEESVVADDVEEGKEQLSFFLGCMDIYVMKAYLLRINESYFTYRDLSYLGKLSFSGYGNLYKTLCPYGLPSKFSR